MELKRILVPVDHSPGSDGIVEYACMVARGMTASLTFMHVYEPPNELVGLVPHATVSGELAAERAAGGEVLERAIAISRASGVAPVDTVLERGSPAYRAIVAHARQGKFDLIVMGTHGRSGLSRWVMGSVAEQVLRHAPCPVLLVHLV
ncbi:MAG TPA: universal stress protein [Kofleriaceae bacterium]|nr:universal stress protein [Kofleriaceae bacterium]